MQTLNNGHVTRIEQIAHALSGLGDLLDYPDDDLVTRISEWRQRFSPHLPNIGALVAAFQADVEKHTTAQLEEIYTRTFDIAPICNPYVTAHIYGDENFERGTLMTKLEHRYREEEFNTNGELPDHLRVILRFAPRFSQEELQELTKYCLLQPVNEMVESLKGQNNPYLHLLLAVEASLRSI
jgi:nitrate reductase molybdenum cofactor assembly chaperone NarJ/NarW